MNNNEMNDNQKLLMEIARDKVKSERFFATLVVDKYLSLGKLLGTFGAGIFIGFLIGWSL